MKTKSLAIALLAVLLAGAVGCYQTYGPAITRTCRFSADLSGQVDLLRREPRRDHISLGEVWIRPSYYMDRYYVEGCSGRRPPPWGPTPW